MSSEVQRLVRAVLSWDPDDPRRVERYREAVTEMVALIERDRAVMLKNNRLVNNFQLKLNDRPRPEVDGEEVRPRPGAGNVLPSTEAGDERGDEEEKEAEKIVEPNRNEGCRMERLRGSRADSSSLKLVLWYQAANTPAGPKTELVIDHHGMYYGREKYRTRLAPDLAPAKYYSPSERDAQTLLSARQAHFQLTYIVRGRRYHDVVATFTGWGLRVIPKRDGSEPINPIWFLELVDGKKMWTKIEFTPEFLSVAPGDRWCLGGRNHIYISPE